MTLSLRATVVALVWCVLAVSSPGQGYCSSVQVEDSSPQETVDGIANKFARGVANVATGWLELPKQVQLMYQEEGPAKGIFVGPLVGLGMFVVRTVAGAVETVTFFVPYPGFYDPMMDPPYVWQNWKKQ